MNRLKVLFFASSILISASALAEGGADRIMERMESLRDKAEATLVQAEKVNRPGFRRHLFALN